MRKSLLALFIAGGLAVNSCFTLDNVVAGTASKSLKERTMVGMSYGNSIDEKADPVSYEVTPKNGDVNIQKVFYGRIAPEKREYKKIGFVDYEEIIRNTPEYKMLSDKKIEKGTGKYWISLSKASDRAIQAITTYADEHGLDFVADQSFMGNLEIKANGKEELPKEIYLTQGVIGTMKKIGAKTS